MRQQNTTKPISNIALAHGSVDFFHYLEERSERRFSRFEAYIYMLDKACAHYRPQDIDPKWIPTIGDGQFFTTKTQLASDWQWHRKTVRQYLKKLMEFGQLIIEDHLKGVLCTLPQLIIPATPGMVVVYNFDPIAKYAMYSWANGTLEANQVANIAGQIERSVNVLLYGDTQSPQSQDQLYDTTHMLLHYAIEAIIARYPNQIQTVKGISDCTSAMDRRLQEFFRVHLAGNWVALFSLLYHKTEVALHALIEATQLDAPNRTTIYERLREEALALLGTKQEVFPPVASRTDLLEESSPDAFPSVGNSEDPTRPHSASDGSVPLY